MGTWKYVKPMGSIQWVIDQLGRNIELRNRELRQSIGMSDSLPYRFKWCPKCNRKWAWKIFSSNAYLKRSDYPDPPHNKRECNEIMECTECRQ